MLYMMRYILWVAARLGAGNVIQDGCQNYPKLDIIMPKTREIENFDAKHKENDTTKYFTAFCQHFVLFNPRTYKQSHTPTVERGRGLMESPLGFLLCCNISKRFHLSSKVYDGLFKMRYILWVAALLGGL